VVELEMRRRVEQGDGGLLQAYHRRVDPLYALPADRREAAFAEVHGALFRELGFERRALGVLAPYQATLQRAAGLALVPAAGAREEGADLGAPTPAGRPARVAIRPGRFLPGGDLEAFLDHEAAHLEDLLDPAFGHEPEALDRIAPERRRLVQERYRAAWAASVDARLERRGRRPLCGPDERRRRLGRAFGGIQGPALDALVAALSGEERPTHARLLATASAGAGAAGPEPGGPCPLCGFPTHEWAEGLAEAAARAIRQDTPAWSPAAGCCQRCLEAYEAMTQTAALSGPAS
jgi:hypothetical protein